MHWICFHFEFEHERFDKDEPCTDPSCPWNTIEDYQEIIKAHQIDIAKELQKIIKRKYVK